MSLPHQFPQPVGAERDFEDFQARIVQRIFDGLREQLFGPQPANFVNREDYHLISNPQIDVEGDRARVRSRHLLVMRGENGSPRPALAGVYEDEFIREDGQWKIRYVLIALSSAPIKPNILNIQCIFK